MVTVSNKDAVRDAQRQRQATAAEQQQREQADRDQAPKRQVRLSVTYQDTTKAAVPGVSPAEIRSVPPGEPVLVAEDEWQRLRKLGVIVETAGESPRGGGPATPAAGEVPGEVYERAAQDIVAGETDVEYAVKGIARHFQADPDVVRKALEGHVRQREQTTAAAQQASGKSSAEWSALSQDERTRLVEAELQRTRGAAK